MTSRIEDQQQAIIGTMTSSGARRGTHSKLPCVLGHGAAANVMELAPVLRSSVAVESSALASTPQESRKTRAVQTQDQAGQCLTAPGRMATAATATLSTACLPKSCCSRRLDVGVPAPSARCGGAACQRAAADKACVPMRHCRRWTRGSRACLTPGTALRGGPAMLNRRLAGCRRSSRPRRVLRARSTQGLLTDG